MNIDKSTYTDYKIPIILIIVFFILVLVFVYSYDYLLRKVDEASYKFEMWRREWWFRNKQLIYQIILGVMGIVVIIILSVLFLRKVK